MSAAAFLAICLHVALGALSLSFVACAIRVVRGPTLPDRVLALDMLTAVAIGFIAVLGIRSGFAFTVDIAIALGLVGFLATVAFARFVLARGRAGEKEADG